MNNTIQTSLLAVTLMLMIISCKTDSKEDTANTTPAEVIIDSEAKDYLIDPEASAIYWMGATLIGKEHTGGIKIKEGKLSTKGNTVLGGKFVIDMNSITNTDILDKEKSAKLISHLKDADFFDSKTFQTGTLEIVAIAAISPPTETANNTLRANLTIKNVTKEISFPAMIKVSDIGVLANATFEINRKDWGIVYGAEGSIEGLAKDKAIKKEIRFNVNLIAK